MAQYIYRIYYANQRILALRLRSARAMYLARRAERLFRTPQRDSWERPRLSPHQPAFRVLAHQELGGGTLLPGQRNGRGRPGSTATHLADQCDRRRIGAVVPQCSFQLPHVAVFEGLRAPSVNAFTIDQPQLPAAGRKALRKDVTRRNATPCEADSMNVVQHPGDCLENSVAILQRQSGPGSAANHFGQRVWRRNLTHNDGGAFPKQAFLEQGHSLGDP